MPDPWNAQMEALGAFIRSQRKLARLSLRQLAELTTGSGDAPDGTPPILAGIEADMCSTKIPYPGKSATI